RKLHCRLEDANGWPLEAPNGEADITRDFGPGHYRLVILPEPTDVRVVTVVEPVTPPRERTGHGPHRLALGDRATHVGLEPAQGEERTPDTWEWQVPAEVHARIELTDGMQGELVRVAEGGHTTAVATLAAGRGFEGTLLPGRHRLTTIYSHTNNQ